LFLGATGGWKSRHGCVFYTEPRSEPLVRAKVRVYAQRPVQLVVVELSLRMCKKGFLFRRKLSSAGKVKIHSNLGRPPHSVNLRPTLLRGGTVTGSSAEPFLSWYFWKGTALPPGEVETHWTVFTSFEMVVDGWQTERPVSPRALRRLPSSSSQVDGSSRNCPIRAWKSDDRVSSDRP
jgi:hypothetical protein